MAKRAYGTINVPWSITASSSYTVIMDGIDVANNTEQSMMTDEDGKRITEIVFGENSEITLNATIKGVTHFGQNTLVNSMITDISDTDCPSPLIVVSNGMSKKKGDWATCTMTCHWFGTDVTSGTASAVIGAVTTTTGA